MSNMDFSLIFKHMDVLLLGTKLTIMMTIGAITIGVVLGTLLGLMRVSRSKIMRLSLIHISRRLRPPPGPRCLWPPGWRCLRS